MTDIDKIKEAGQPVGRLKSYKAWHAMIKRCTNPKHVYYNIDKNILVLVNHDGIIIAPKYPADKSGTYFYVGKP